MSTAWSLSKLQGVRAACVLYVLLTVVFVATAPANNLTAHTPFNHYALLADAWVHGRLDLGGPPPDYTQNNDFAEFGGKYFVSFPPFPAVLLVPIVKIAGSPERVRDGQFFLWLAALGPSVLYLVFEKLARTGRSARTPVENLALALLFGVGTVYWFTAVQGTVWYAAHIIGVVLTAIYILCSLDAEHSFFAGLTLALAFATRPPIALAVPLFAYEALRSARRPDAGEKRGLRRYDVRLLANRIGLFTLPVVLVLAILFAYNQARFGDPLEFGHKFLAIAWRPRIEKWGLFSYHYLGRNLAVVLTSLPYFRTPGAPLQINAHGLALWVTTPIYAWAIWPKRTDAFFWAVATSALAVALPDLLYQNSGWIQFGYRFSTDFAPFLFVLIAVGARRFSAPFWALAAVGIVVNGFGAATFERATFARFYFVDGTQRILHQPD